MLRRVAAVAVLVAACGGEPQGDAPSEASAASLETRAPATYTLTLRNDTSQDFAIAGDFLTVDTPTKHSTSLQVFDKRQIAPGETLRARVPSASAGDIVMFSWLLNDPTGASAGGSASYWLRVAEGTTNVDVRVYRSPYGYRHECRVGGTPVYCPM